MAFNYKALFYVENIAFDSSDHWILKAIPVWWSGFECHFFDAGECVKRRLLPHHIQVVAFFFKSMRNFADHLSQKEEPVHEVFVYQLRSVRKCPGLGKMITKLVKKKVLIPFRVHFLMKYRLDSAASKKFQISWLIPIKKRFGSEHFFLPNEIFAGLFSKVQKDRFLMETFIRQNAEKILTILMEGKRPIDRQVEFDAEKRGQALKDNVFAVSQLHPKFCGSH